MLPRSELVCHQYLILTIIRIITNAVPKTPRYQEQSRPMHAQYNWQNLMAKQPRTKWVSSKKWPAFRCLILTLGISRLYASAPAGTNTGSLEPQKIMNGAWVMTILVKIKCVRPPAIGAPCSLGQTFGTRDKVLHWCDDRRKDPSMHQSDWVGSIMRCLRYTSPG